MVRDCLTAAKKSRKLLSINDILFVPKRQIEVRFLMKSGLILQDSCDIAKRQFYDIPASFIEWFFASIFFSIDFTMDYIDFVLPECLHTKI